jgi:mono/diheme cytochrome c family protein
MPKTFSLAALIALASACPQALAHGHGAETHQAAGAHSHGVHEGAAMADHWAAPAREARRRNPVRANRASLQRGETLYRAHCALCHGEAGEGDGPAAAALTPKPTNFRELMHHHGDGDLAWKIAQGRGPMPAWKSRLRRRQIWDLVNYVKRFSEAER